MNYFALYIYIYIYIVNTYHTPLTEFVTNKFSLTLTKCVYTLTYLGINTLIIITHANGYIFKHNISSYYKRLILCICIYK